MAAALRFFVQRVCGLEWNPVSPLRQRMIEDMRLHHFSAKTQSSYLRSVLGLACHDDRSPDQIVEEQIRRYFLHLTCERKLARPTITIALCGIKFFYEKTLKRDWSLTGVPVPKREKKLPVVLSRKETHKILSYILVPRHRACLSLIYACGLRLGEACRIKVSDLDRARGLVHVRGGKGARDRYVPLPKAILPLLEDCWRSHRNPLWLFPWVGRGARQGQWMEAHPKFLVPVPALSAVFRARFRDALKEQFPDIFAQIKPKVWKQKKWVVHSKPVGAGIMALAYLARYVHRVALSQRAILQHDPTGITVRYRKSETNELRTMRLKPHEFIRRFLPRESRSTCQRGHVTARVALGLPQDTLLRPASQLQASDASAPSSGYGHPSRTSSVHTAQRAIANSDLPRLSYAHAT